MVRFLENQSLEIDHPTNSLSNSSTLNDESNYPVEHSTNRKNKRFKVLIVGSTLCGKTTLLNALTNSCYFKLSKEDKIFNAVSYCLPPRYSMEFNIDEIELWDISGKSEYSDFLHLSFKNTTLVLACFSITEPLTLYELEKKILPQIYSNLEQVYVILVGCKNDLKDQKDYSINLAQGWNTADRIGAVYYVETSSFTKIGCDDLMLKILHLLSIDATKKKTKGCIIC